jgi:hypothetical protein
VTTAAKLKSRTVKELAAMAKRKRVPGWHSMRKDELVRVLARLAKSDKAKTSRNGRKSTARSGSSKTAASASGNGSRRTERDRAGAAARQHKRQQHQKAKQVDRKDLAFTDDPSGNGYTKDRLVVMVRDPFWLHAYWELTRRSVERARIAMGPRWHAAKPVLRLLEVTRDGTTNTVRNVVRDIEIHGGVNNWYIDVHDPPKSFQLDIGYLAPDGSFLCLCRSNVITTPQVGAVDAVDGNWAPVAEDFDRIYALSGGYTDADDNGDLKDLFETRLRRPMGSPMMTRFGLGASAGGRSRRDLPFHVDAELVVYGATDPSAHVTLRGEPVRLQADGTFTVRFTLPDRRQVLPVVASSNDGVEQRTIVLAVERNTKVMEPVIREPDQ